VRGPPEEIVNAPRESGTLSEAPPAASLLQHGLDRLRRWLAWGALLPGSEPADRCADRHQLLLERAIGCPAVAGNRASILIDGPATHAAMFDAIGQARDHINIESYIVEDDGPGRELAGLLMRKCAEGVRVNLMYDGWGSWRTPGRYFDALRAAGVKLLEFNPINPLRHPIAWSLHLRNHRKLLIVDGRAAFIGGVNISGVYSSMPGRKNDAPWRDTHLRVEGPVVAELQQLFIDHWRDSARRPPQPADYFPPLAPAGEQRLTVAACTVGRRRNPLYRALLAAIADAEQCIFITAAYFVPTRRLVRALVAAARRGVDVRLALPGVSDVWAPLAAGRSKYGRLLASGVHIYERHNAMLHAKTAVIDGVWATVGSSNMDWRSILHNAEANVVILDRGFAADMEALFLADIAQSREITFDDWARRGVVARSGEWLARKLEFLL
jgi:cardiolipin synthase A/B